MFAIKVSLLTRTIKQCYVILVSFCFPLQRERERERERVREMIVKLVVKYYLHNATLDWTGHDMTYRRKNESVCWPAPCSPVPDRKMTT